jgi:hypothetical protein
MEKILHFHVAACEKAQREYKNKGTPISMELFKDEPTQYTGMDSINIVFLLTMNLVKFNC